MDQSQWPNAGNRITITPSSFLTSPAFKVTYPTVRGLEMTATASRAGMELSWKAESFAERPINVFDVRDVYVVDENLVFDKNLQLISNMSDVENEEEVERAIIRIQKRVKTLPHFGKTTILAKRRAAGNYGHFLLEMLPIAEIVRHLLQSPSPRFVVHAAPPAISDVVFRAFRLLGIPLKDVVVQQFGEPMWFDRLIALRGITQHSKYMSPYALVAALRLESAVLQSNFSNKVYPKRIFVRRVPGWGTGRVLHNESEVVSRLTTKGFVEVEPGELCLEEQIMAFHAADQVIGVGGAAMTNIVFCKPGTKVVLLWPASFPDTFFWSIAGHKSLAYSEVRGKQTTDDGPHSWQSGFTLSEEDIQYLEAMV